MPDKKHGQDQHGQRHGGSAHPGDDDEAEPSDLGKEPEAAAPSGAESKPTPGVSPLGQGAQVVLTGDAQAAARGGPHNDITSNTVARDAAIEAGHVAKGTTAEAAADATENLATPKAPTPKAP